MRFVKRHAVLLAASTALAISLPSLGAGLYDDDVWQRRFLLDQLHGARSDPWWNMFGTPLEDGVVAQMIFRGFLPWWTSHDFQLSFFRPLAVATHMLDYSLWPNQPWLMHLQNSLLYAALCGLVATYFQFLFGRTGVAAAAALLYSIGDAQLEGVAWISARNTLLTAVFGMLTLCLLESGAKRAAWLAAASQTLSHLSSEGAIAVWPYLLGSLWLRKRSGRKQQLLRMIPTALVSSAFSIVTTHFDYVVVGSGAYIDPRRRPLDFLHAVVERLPRLFMLEVGPPAWLSGSFGAPTPEQGTGLAAACIWFLLAGLLLRDKASRSTTSALMLGALGSALAVCAARPEPRLLLMAGVGMQGVNAQMLELCLRKLCELGSVMRRLVWLMATVWVVVMNVLLPIPASWKVPEMYRAKHEELRRAATQMDLQPADAASIVLVLNAPSYFDALKICTYRLEMTETRPWRTLHILGSSQSSVTLRHVSQLRLELSPLHGYLRERTSQQAHAADVPFQVGQRVALDGLDVTVTALTADARPATIVLDLAPDEVSHLQFLAWSSAHRTFEQVTLPKVGHWIRL